MSKILDFSEILITKLCHDLASTIGAVNNGIEIFKDEKDENLRQKALGIIELNGEEAATKIKFFRWLYGVVRSNGEIDVSEIKQLVEDYFHNSKVKLVWHNMDDQGLVQLTGKAAKLLVNMVYMAATSLIAGGQIEISISRDQQSKKISVIASNEKVKVNEEVRIILEDHELMDIKLSNVHAHLLSKIAASLGVVVECEHDDKSFSLVAELT
jgi:histidine phosphotransferase ChpT